VDLTTPTKITRAGHEEVAIDVTTPSAHVQGSDTNNESDFLLQDTDEDQEFQDTNSSNVDGASNDLAFHFKSEDQKQAFGVISAVTSQARCLLVTQSQENANPMDENVAVHTAIAVQNDSWELVL
jgi:hypothetical protein